MKNLFAQRLTELLKVTQMSKRAFAKAIGVSAMSVSDWAAGNVQPTADNILAAATFFHVSTDYLLGLEDDEGNKLYPVR